MASSSSSSCRSTCTNDARVPAAVRPTYLNLHKWPESEEEFVRSRSCNGCLTGHAHVRVVDSLSCRQMYLRSYTFSRKKESVHEKISRRVKEIRVKNTRKRRKLGKSNNKASSVVSKKCVVLRRAKEASCAALSFMFRRLRELACTAKVDAADDHHHHRRRGGGGDQRHG